MSKTPITRSFAATGAFTFTEVIIAIFVAAVLSLPIIYMVVSSRTDTARAISYLRAVELAHEVIEWVNVTPLNDETIMQLKEMEGSMTIAAGGAAQPRVFEMAPSARWEPVMDNLSYDNEYVHSWFYRKIDIERVSQPGLDYDSYLFNVTVTILWNEGIAPDQPDFEDRERMVVVSTLALDETRGY